MGLVEHVCASVALGYVLRSAAFCGPPLRVPIRREDDRLPSISIVVPARNEEDNIERCVRSLLAQTHHDYEVIAVDDCSSDATRQILERLAAHDPRLRIVAGRPLPPGWVGKPWAIHQGVQQARGAWLLFSDADTFHQPFALTSTLCFAREHQADALSLGTLLELESFWERAVLPSIMNAILLFAGTYEELNDPKRPDRAIANGQFILVDRRAYDALGGHARLRAQIAEDLEFARLVKRDGRFRLVLASGEDVVSVRMYRTPRAIWEGFTKNVVLGANGNIPATLAGAAALAAISIVPPLLGLRALRRRRWTDGLEALCTSAATIIAMAAALRQTRLSPRLACYAPIGLTVLAAIALNAALRVGSGRGVSWRGRPYTGRVTPLHGGTTLAS